MKTRLIAGIIAVLLAAAGTVVLVSYVRNADARAVADLDPVLVLVATTPIAQGTPADNLSDLVETTELPATAALAGGVTSLSQLQGQIALTPMYPGEQLISSKFGAPPTEGPDAVKVDPALQKVSVLLELHQAVGGNIAPGDTVGVFLSTDKPDANNPRTHLTVNKVLVTDVQWPAPKDQDKADGVTPASSSDIAQDTGDLTGKVIVTLATTAPDAEQIVFAANYGSVWLSDEPATADENGTEVIDPTKVFK